MNRPRQRRRQFVHIFQDGNQVVATERDRGRLFTLEWRQPLHESSMGEYMTWTRQVLFEVSRPRLRRNKPSKWTMFWPDKNPNPTEWLMWSAY